MRITIAIAALLLASPAFAQDVAQNVAQVTRHAPNFNEYDAKLEPVTVSPLNADKLNGTTLVAIVNKTHASIKGIACDGHLWGTAAIAVPGGRIPSGGIGIVDFNKGDCRSGIHVTTSDGQLHEIAGQNINDLTVLTIESENW